MQMLSKDVAARRRRIGKDTPKRRTRFSLGGASLRWPAHSDVATAVLALVSLTVAHMVVLALTSGAPSPHLSLAFQPGDSSWRQVLGYPFADPELARSLGLAAVAAFLLVRLEGEMRRRCICGALAAVTLGSAVAFSLTGGSVLYGFAPSVTGLMGLAVAGLTGRAKALSIRTPSAGSLGGSSDSVLRRLEGRVVDGGFLVACWFGVLMPLGLDPFSTDLVPMLAAHGGALVIGGLSGTVIASLRFAGHIPAPMDEVVDTWELLETLAREYDEEAAAAAQAARRPTSLLVPDEHLEAALDWDVDEERINEPPVRRPRARRLISRMQRAVAPEQVAA